MIIRSDLLTKHMEPVQTDTSEVITGCRGAVRALVFLALTAMLASQKAFSQAEDNAMADRAIMTEHTAMAQGRVLRYKAHTGFLTLRDAQNQMRGRMFYVYYSTSEHADHTRPVLFAWNGGPGSSASQLDLGGVGPRLLSQPGGAEGAIVDNPDTWLRFADLVFIDPIGTGYSYAATPKDQKMFFSDDGDADSVAEFIRLFRAHYRWTEAPVYMLGESYGTFRAALVANLLTQRNIMPAGVLLVSTVFQPQMDGNLRASFSLPNYVATVLGRRQHEQDELVAEVNASEEWSRTTYLPALIAGERLPSSRRSEIASHLEKITGVPAAVWTAHNLVLSADDFATAVAGKDGTRYVGHYDTRLTGTQDAGAPYDVSRDPSLRTMHDLDAAMPTYLDRELGFNSDAFFAGPFGGRWLGSTDDHSEWSCGCSMRLDTLI